MNRKYPHFAIPEIYGESLSYYELLRKLVTAMNVMIDNYDTIPDQIAEAVANLDASQLFSAVLDQIIDSIATDNTKSANAVKVYKKHDLLYATLNETVNLYESLIDFTNGTETELIIGTNIREVNISELFIELRTLIKYVTSVANENSAEITAMHNYITGIESKNTEQDNEISTLRTMISSPYNFKGDVASLSALPASGEVNDTYYVQDIKYKVTWTGSAWVQSSLSEADYQTELNEINGDLTLCYKNEKEIIKNNDIDIIVAKYVGEFWNTSNTNQKDNNIPNAMYTDLFEVNVGDEIIVTSNSYLSAVAYILYDSDKNVVSYEQNNMKANKTYNVVIPSNVKYMRASSLDKDAFALKMKNTILDDINKNISNIESDILSIPSGKFAVGIEEEIPSNLYITGKFINKSASEVDNENSKCTDYLSLVEYPVMYVSAKSMYATCIYALYDANKNPVMKDVAANIYATFGYDSEYTNKLICASDILKEYPTARYIRYSTYPTTQKDLKVIYRPLMNIFDVIAGNTLSNKSVYVFGDSIMHGHIDGYGIAELLSDEKHMIATNYAQNGKMISSGEIYMQINNASDTIPDFIIFDGYINDMFQDIINFGEISDDYNTFPDTFCGQFEKVCNIIRTKYPTSKVFYFTVHKINFHMTQQKQLHSLCVEMCKKWNISVIDMFNDGQMNTYLDYQKTNYTKNSDGTHPTTEAYKKYYLPMLLDKMILN